MTDKERPEKMCCTESIIKKRLLWCSEQGYERGKTFSDFADQLWLLHIDDGQWALRLQVSGEVITMPIKNIEKYI